MYIVSLTCPCSGVSCCALHGWPSVVCPRSALSSMCTLLEGEAIVVNPVFLIKIWEHIKYLGKVIWDTTGIRTYHADRRTSVTCSCTFM